MDPEEIARKNEEDKVQPTTPQTTELSSQPAPTTSTPVPGFSQPTKVTSTGQATPAGFQQANQVKMQALGNIAQQRMGERLGAVNKSIEGQKAARVEDINAQQYTGPRTATLEQLGGDQTLQTTLSGAGRQADISKAAGQVAGFGAYNELKNLAGGGMNRGYLGGLGLNGGRVDSTLARTATPGLHTQTLAANNQLKNENANLLKPIQAAGADVSKNNIQAQNEIQTNLQGQAGAAEAEGLQNLSNATNTAESQAVARANSQINQQKQAKIAQANALKQQYAGQDNLKAGGDYIREMLANLQQELANGPAQQPGRLTTQADIENHRVSTQAKIDSVMANINKSKLAEGKLRQSNQMLADANKLQNITSLGDANNRTLSPAEYNQLQASKQALAQARSQLGNKATGLSSLSQEKQAGYQALQNILKDPSKLSTIDNGAGSYSNFQNLLNKVR